MGWMGARRIPGLTPRETRPGGAGFVTTMLGPAPVEELPGSRLGALLPMFMTAPIGGGVSVKPLGLRVLSILGPCVIAASMGGGVADVDAAELSTWTRCGGGGGGVGGGG